MFFAVPYSIFWELKTGEKDPDLLGVVEALRGDLLTDKQADATIRYNELTSQQHDPKEYKKTALEIVDIYEDFYKGLHSILEKLKVMI